MDEIKVLKQYQDDYCALYNGDSCEIVKMFDENSMDLMVYSPPFSSLARALAKIGKSSPCLQ